MSAMVVVVAAVVAVIPLKNNQLSVGLEPHTVPLPAFDHFS